MLLDLFSNRRVFLTGHTGFKGSWLAEWLLLRGADVTGYALPPPTKPALFEQLGLRQRLRHMEGDVRDLAALTRAVVEVKPDFVFHLAAQPLVRHSYAQPVETFATNVMGTVNLLEALRVADARCIVVVATTDKCYENREIDHPYREYDPLGGRDPYSASKACAEIALAAYRQSFFKHGQAPIALASARAGNVLGGGDWASDRIIPDCIRSLQTKQIIKIRNPRAIRPWQHVLESLSGYLVLAAEINQAQTVNKSERLSSLCSSFNFGPEAASQRCVRDVVEEVLKRWPGTWVNESTQQTHHEAGRLQLSIEKAAQLLHWRPVWDFQSTITETVDWYRHCDVDVDPKERLAFSRRQIRNYEFAARHLGLPWAV